MCCCGGEFCSLETSTEVRNVWQIKISKLESTFYILFAEFVKSNKTKKKQKKVSEQTRESQFSELIHTQKETNLQTNGILLRYFFRKFKYFERVCFKSCFFEKGFVAKVSILYAHVHLLLHLNIFSNMNMNDQGHKLLKPSAPKCLYKKHVL